MPDLSKILTAKQPLTLASLARGAQPLIMSDLARASKHLTPSLFARECAKLNRSDVTIYAYHMKPAYKLEIIEELQQFSIPNLMILEEGQRLSIS